MRISVLTLNYIGQRKPSVFSVLCHCCMSLGPLENDYRSRLQWKQSCCCLDWRHLEESEKGTNKQVKPKMRLEGLNDPGREEGRRVRGRHLLQFGEGGSAVWQELMGWAQDLAVGLSKKRVTHGPLVPMHREDSPGLENCVDTLLQLLLHPLSWFRFLSFPC